MSSKVLSKSSSTSEIFATTKKDFEEEVRRLTKLGREIPPTNGYDSDSGQDTTVANDDDDAAESAAEVQQMIDHQDERLPYGNDTDDSDVDDSGTDSRGDDQHLLRRGREALDRLARLDRAGHPVLGTD
ncbi:hypothetical protein PV08_09193 [Exophiala spinifera]|uniref:Uncharacterized protein n=1 Tax=Exophiala spinifera TaxID=91928 RepID=A0A0D2AZP6_9EURO|nr:uncharacterized protein PV08_09193 [Exophiala spinifera]KIW11920.1 hypothetical protein PV08_09193 [Exophiala spinifera]